MVRKPALARAVPCTLRARSNAIARGFEPHGHTYPSMTIDNRSPSSGADGTLAAPTPPELGMGSGPIVVDSGMRALFRTVARLGPTSVPLLVLGETGSGKEVVADWAHRAAGSSSRRLVKVNCAGLTESLVESELFGHERGAFTGAFQTRQGLFELAHRGTLFLDELSELPLSTQAKLLRVIETGEFRRLGSTHVRQVEVRFVSATHRSLLQSVSKGSFRQDLYFRLRGAILEVPPLRERPSEIIPLAAQFLSRSVGDSKQLAPDAIEVLRRHSWPGNVRELRNVVECAAAISEGSCIRARHLDFAGALVDDNAKTATKCDRVTLESERSTRDIRATLQDVERREILSALDQTAGNQTRAADILGISRRTLTNKLNAHRIERPLKRTTLPNAAAAFFAEVPERSVAPRTERRS